MQDAVVPTLSGLVAVRAILVLRDPVQKLRVLSAGLEKLLKLRRAAGLGVPLSYGSSSAHGLVTCNFF